MKKPTIKSLKKKLDKLFSEIIRQRGACEKCGRKEHLQTAHIMSRRYLGLRWDKENALCLCYACHFFWAHRNPIEFAVWVENHIGKKRLGNLVRRAIPTKKWSIPEMQDLLTKLEKPNLCVR